VLSRADNNSAHGDPFNLNQHGIHLKLNA